MPPFNFYQKVPTGHILIAYPLFLLGTRRKPRYRVLFIPPRACNHYVSLDLFEERGLFGADVAADGTAGMKAATGGDISWTGHFTGKNDDLSPLSLIGRANRRRTK
jgi:hypothetical protein